MKNLFRILIAIASITVSVAHAATSDFNENFCDSTLRLYCAVGANRGVPFFGIERATIANHWGGRKVNLDKLHYAGNGTVTVIDAISADTIYRHSFSTLFNEWLSLDTAASASAAFQHAVAIPRPRRDATVNIAFTNPRHETILSASWRFNPTDILIADHTAREPFPHELIHKATVSESPINVAILAEGYTPDEMSTFRQHADTAVSAILAHEPFGKFADRFNFYIVYTPSQESGVSIPKNNDWKTTAFGSHFSTFYSNRYLTTENIHTLHAALEGVPAEHIIVLANTPEYGGGGIYNNYTLTTALEKKFKPVVVHEFGHSFGGLADEYYYANEENNDSYPTDIEPWEPNITTLASFNGKWENCTGNDGKPLLIEGAAYSAKGRFRAEENCRMRTNDPVPFCIACRIALERLINFLTCEDGN